MSEVKPLDRDNNDQYRFFYHYFKRDNTMTVHYKNTCMHSKNVICHVPCETKWNDKQQPHLVMRGWASEVIEKDDHILIK